MSWLVMGGLKMNFKNVIHTYMCVCLYMCGSDQANVTYI